MHRVIYERKFWDREYFGFVLAINIMFLFLSLILFMRNNVPYVLVWCFGPAIILYCSVCLYLAHYFNIKYMRTFYHGYYLFFEVIKFASMAILFILGAVLFVYFIPDKDVRSLIILSYSIVLTLVYPYQICNFLRSQQDIKRLYRPHPINGKVFIDFYKIMDFELKRYKGTWNLFNLAMIPYLAFLAIGGKLFQINLANIAISTGLLYFGVYWHFRLNRALYSWFFLVRKVQKETGCYIYSDVYNILKGKSELKKKLLANDTGNG